ncbi:MAG: S8 family serine peptidase [Acetobacteraceae bacterium]
MKAKPAHPPGRRPWLLAAALLLALAASSAHADDDDDASPGAPPGADAGGDGSRPGGFPGLGPTPGRIPVPSALQGLFGGAPPRPGVELVAAGLPPGAATALRAAGFTVLSERGGVARLRGPSGVGEAAALARLRAAAPGALADRNHRFRLAADTADADAAPAAPTPACAAPPGLLVALVDTGVDARHPDLVGVIERQESFRAPGRRAARTAHGTAIAVRLATALPGARIAVLDAFHATADGDAADAFDLAAALARTAEIGARIANLSFVGPRNAVLDRLGAEAAAAGVLFVAAAGNDGPRAPPLYPAAHPWALAIAAVDANGRPWSRSAAGPHIAFSAIGVQVALPPPPGGRTRAWYDTSPTAPVVTAILARPPKPHPKDLVALARDAGPPGRDPVFGWGVVEPPSCDAPLRTAGD